MSNNSAALLARYADLRRFKRAVAAQVSNGYLQPGTDIFVNRTPGRLDLMGGNDDYTGGLVFEIEANRFLHHMVRFLVGTMLDIAAARRPLVDFARLLGATDNAETSPPAPAHALFLEAVVYPPDLYLQRA